MQQDYIDFVLDVPKSCGFLEILKQYISDQNAEKVRHSQRKQAKNGRDCLVVIGELPYANNATIQLKVMKNSNNL